MPNINIESQIGADKLYGCYLDANEADRLDINKAIMERCTKEGKVQLEAELFSYVISTVFSSRGEVKRILSIHK